MMLRENQRHDIHDPKARQMSRQIVVIGAGIVGISTAIWLRRAGVEVTVIDRGLPGTGTSHGNAGVLASCSMVPVTAPGLLHKAPMMLLNNNFPLFLRWSYLPRLLPWLRRYMANANDSDTRRIAKALTPIVGDSVEQHKSLCGELGLGDWVTDSDYCFAYSDRAHSRRTNTAGSCAEKPVSYPN